MPPSTVNTRCCFQGFCNLTAPVDVALQRYVQGAHWVTPKVENLSSLPLSQSISTLSEA